LRTIGDTFTFMGSQYRLEVDGKEFFIDLLLFHQRLRALVMRWRCSPERKMPRSPANRPARPALPAWVGGLEPVQSLTSYESI